MTGDGAVRNWHFVWHSMFLIMCEEVHCHVELAQHDIISLVSTLSVPLDIFQSDQRSRFLLVGCLGAQRLRRRTLSVPLNRVSSFN